MEIESVRIVNFRSYKDETINFDNYTCFVGANGAGKSTVFNALNVFFRQSKDIKTDINKLVESDFHHKNTSIEIRITVTFRKLSDSAKADLAAYVRQEKLIISAVAIYDTSTGKAEVKQYGNRLGFKTFKRFFEEEKAGAKVGELQKIYTELKTSYPDLPKVTSKGDMASALQEYESNNPDKCDLIPSEDQFYGATKGANKLSPHIQWVFVSASKDVTEEGEESKTSALGQLLSRTVRSKVSFNEKIQQIRNETRAKYEELLGKEQSVLDEISKSLQTRLSGWAHPNISAQVLWKQDPEKSVKVEEPFAYIKIGERGFEGDLARFGHGLQRSYMLALLQELAQIHDTSAPTLVMGIEEPELYQHPPQARYLAETLLDLAEADTQIILCTHSPTFIPSDSFDKIRIVREYGDPSYTTVKNITYKNLSDTLASVGEKHLKEEGMIAKLYPSLNSVINEMFFCRTLILVEGKEDVAYLTSYLMLSGQVSEFRKYGCHIVPTDGKSRIIKPLAMARLLGIPVFVIFDADTNKTNNGEILRHKKDNKSLLTLQGYPTESEWPSINLVKHDLVLWKTNLTETISSELGADWENYKNKSSAYYDNAGDLEKNPLAVAKTLELAWNDGKKSQILLDLIQRIIEFAKDPKQ